MNEQNEHKPSFADHPIKILNYSVIAMIVLLLVGFIVLKLGSTIMGIVLMSVGVCCVIVALTVFWRCPACDVELPLSAYKKKSCPYCGNKLD